MSWTFEVPSECDLFKLVISSAKAGDVMENRVVADEIPGTDIGIVRTASATVEGHLHIEWEDGHTLDQHGPEWGDPSLGDQQLKIGKTTNTPVTDVLGVCAFPNGERKLSRKWYTVAEGETIQHTQPGYLVVVKGEVLANAHVVPRFTIARSDSFDITPTEDSIFMIIWER